MKISESRASWLRWLDLFTVLFVALGGLKAAFVEDIGWATVSIVLLMWIRDCEYAERRLQETLALLVEAKKMILLAVFGVK